MLLALSKFALCTFLRNWSLASAFALQYSKDGTNVPMAEEARK
jgi:hypothetical protein